MLPQLRSVVVIIVVSAVLVLVPNASGGSAHVPDSPLFVQLRHGGIVAGKYATSLSGRGIRSFLEIPYAEPPVGALRYADPIPKTPWDGILSCAESTVMCVQRDIYMRSPHLVGQEDCLYLNVHVPLVSWSCELPQRAELLDRIKAVKLLLHMYSFIQCECCCRTLLCHW